MLPATYNIALWKGATYTKHILLLSSTGPGARDLTNYTGMFIVRSAVGSPITYEVPLTLGGPFGTIDLNIPASVTPTLTSGVYELDITSPTNVVTALLTGAFNVKGIV